MSPRVAPRNTGGDVATGSETSSGPSGVPTAMARPVAPTNLVEPLAGSRLGRYLVISELGRGGVGVVYRAYDPKLQREVALKCVRPDVADRERHERLVREAQAMARLSHANVVSVYDVERVGDVVVIAMELIDGITLSRWLANGAHPWREVVAKFVAAGRGLQAAHQAGMLHRDFKPGNVVLGADGRPRVTDFGLARLRDSPKASASSDDIAGLEPEVDIDAVWTSTQANGASEGNGVHGTPPYMAPEQHENGVLTPAVDQYALCVSLWQALVGQLPFGGSRGRPMAALLESKRNGPPPWPKQVVVPRRLSDALRRGLDPNPARRWPSMEAMLAALTFEPRRGRSAVVGAVGLAVVVSTSVVAVGWSRRRNEICTGAASQLVGVWDPTRRVEVERALRGSPVPYAGSVLDRVVPALDAYGEQWVTSYADSCEATALRQEQSPEVMELRMACLHAAKLELAAASSALRVVDTTTMEKAHELVGGLPELARCADVEALRARVPPPATAEAAQAVQLLDVELAQARTQLALGDYRGALAGIRDLADDVEQIDYDPLRMRWLLLEGEILRNLGAFADAETSLRLRGALHTALQRRQWSEALVAAQQLTYVVGYRLKRHGEALAYGHLALGLSEGLGDGREATTHDGIGAVLESEGKFAPAEAEYRKALALRKAQAQPDSLQLARSHSNIGGALNGEGRYDQGEAEQRAALALRIAALGPDHPEVARSHNNLGNSLYGRGKYADAAAQYRLALDLGLRALGSDHPDVASSHNNLGNALLQLGEFAAAAREQRVALTSREKALGAAHPDVAKSHNNLGNALFFEGKLEEAEAEYRRGLSLRIAALGPDHPDVAASHHSLGNALAQQGDYEAATLEYELALIQRVDALGSDHPDTAASRLGLGNAWYHRGAFAKALLEYTRVLEEWERSLGPDHPDVASARYSVANALFELEKYVDAKAQYTRALAIREAALGPDHPSVAQVAHGLANALEQLGRSDDAAAFYERTARIYVAVGAAIELRAENDFALARVLWSRRDQRTRARSLAIGARDPFAAAGPAEAQNRQACEQWLVRHR